MIFSKTYHLLMIHHRSFRAPKRAGWIFAGSVLLVETIKPWRHRLSQPPPLRPVSSAPSLPIASSHHLIVYDLYYSSWNISWNNLGGVSLRWAPTDTGHFTRQAWCWRHCILWRNWLKTPHCPQYPNPANRVNSLQIWAVPTRAPQLCSPDLCLIGMSPWKRS